MTRFSANLKKMRRRRGYTLEALGRRCGMSKTQISYLERRPDNANVATIEILCVGLNCTEADLFSPLPLSPLLARRHRETAEALDVEPSHPSLETSPPFMISRHDHRAGCIELRKRIACNVVRLRNDRGWSQGDLARRCGRNRSFIGTIERAKASATLSTIALLAAAFDCMAIELFWYVAPFETDPSLAPAPSEKMPLAFISGPHQSLHIGTDIRVDILGVDPDYRVHLGVTAPRTLDVQLPEPIGALNAKRTPSAKEARVTIDTSAFRSIALLVRSAVAEAPGKSELLAVSSELDQTIRAGQEAVDWFLTSTRGLSELQAGLTELRRALEAMRDRSQSLELRARAVIQASHFRLTGYQTVLSLIWQYGRFLDDLLGALPQGHDRQFPKDRPRRRAGRDGDSLALDRRSM